MSMRRTLPMHLLHVLAHRPCCAANGAIVQLGVSPEALGQAALDALEVPAPAPARPRVTPAPARPPLPNVKPTFPAHPIANRRADPQTKGLWLGEEVEARLRQSDAHPREHAPATFADQVEAKLRRRR
jgi:hypothetical protein